MRGHGQSKTKNKRCFCHGVLLSPTETKSTLFEKQYHEPDIQRSMPLRCLPRRITSLPARW